MSEIPRFEILDQIGHGQFSTVYKARWINAPHTPSNGPQMTEHEQQVAIEAIKQPFASGEHQIIPAQDNRSKTDNLFNDYHEMSPNHNQLAKSEQQKIDGHQRNTYVALKRIKFFDFQNSKLRMDYFKEVKLLQQLKHPNIINYNISFIERNELFIVLELADGGDLSKLIKYFQRRNQLLSERTVLKYFTQVCSAIRYIHSKRILHRDIKPANIFMTSDGCVKLGDFGLGRFFSQNTLDAHSIVGTFYYMSPERIREAGYSFSSDIWSLGCVLYELMTLNSPFSIVALGPHNKQINQSAHRAQDADRFVKKQAAQPAQQNGYNLQWHIERILRAEYPSLAPYIEYSPRLRQLATECLNPNPDARPNMDYVCAVVGEAYRVQQLSQQSLSSSSQSSTSPSSSTHQTSQSSSLNSITSQSSNNRTTKQTVVPCQQ